MKESLSEILEGKKTVALGGHIRPDGDCIGSCMGLYLYMREQYPWIETDVYLEETAICYQMIEGIAEIRHEIPADRQYDLFICLDCADKKRLGFSAPLMEKARHTFCIDHHVSNEAFAEKNYIVPDASSTSELVYHLLDTDKISYACAQALYMGIAHDTGIFQYSCTKPETMEAAAALLRKGIDGNEIIDKTYYEKSYAQNRITGKALLESRLLFGGTVIVSCVSREDMETFGVTPCELDGIVSQLRNTRGTKAAVFLYELESRTYKVSLRSKQEIDVSLIARHFGGGGHKRAAGFDIQGDVEDIIRKVGSQILPQLPLDKGESS